jgi:hypothetical protein
MLRIKDIGNLPTHNKGFARSRELLHVVCASERICSELMQTIPWMVVENMEAGEYMKAVSFACYIHKFVRRIWSDSILHYV